MICDEVWCDMWCGVMRCGVMCHEVWCDVS